METFLSLCLNKMVDRFAEVKLLLDLAEKNKFKTNIYNCLCKSASILIVAHFEGSLKDITESILEDINKFGRFSDSSQDIKRTFCGHFFQNSEISEKNREQSIKKLIATLNDLDTKLVKEAFIYKDNKNPSAKYIDTLAAKFGISNFLRFIHDSKLDVVFEGSLSDIEKLKKDMFDQLIDSSKEFPYKIDYSEYCFNESILPKNNKSLWNTFIEDMLRNRNNIAHGTITNDNYSLYELGVTALKVQIITFAFALIIAQNSYRIQN